MGRGAYLYLLTLGRQCYEPHQGSSRNESPNNRNPSRPLPSTTSAERTDPRATPSIELQRSLRKAQNDVLTTVGRHLHKHPNRMGDRASQSEEQERENDVGLFLGGFDLAASYFFTWPLTGIRNELQVDS